MKPLLLLLALASAANAQSVCNSFHDLGDKIVLHSALYVDGPLYRSFYQSEATKRLCHFEAGAGFLRRTLDVPSARTFGYEVHVSRNPSGKKPYHVRVTPVQGSGSTLYFPRGPEPVDVDSDETIEFALFVLESSEGTARLVERLQVTSGLPTLYSSPMQALVPARTPIALVRPSLSLKDGKSRPFTTIGTVRGPNIWIYLPGIGRVWLSSVRQPGFETTVPIHGNQFEFRWDGLDYVVSTAGPIIDLPGDWSVWMRLERDWRPSSKPDVLAIGASAL